jgi:sialic acid synthase SpsE
MKMNPKYIAEIGSNHNNKLQRIEKLIYTAKELGFWAVKFQLFRAEYLYWSGETNKIHNAIDNELDLDLVYYIKDICNDCNIRLMFTPFDLNAINFLRDKTDYYKISSFDILRDCFITEAFNANMKTLFLSTGLATDTDIRKCINYINQHKAVEESDGLLNICLMHCVSKYPTKKKEANIHVIRDLIQSFSLFVNHFGYSDHTVNIDVIKAAIKLGAEYIELHFDLDDKKGAEYKYGHCWTPKKIKKLFKFSHNLNSLFINNLNYNYIINNFGTAKPLTKDELGQRADPSDGLRPMLYKRVKKSL